MKKEKFKRVRVLCREDSLRDVLAVLRGAGSQKRGRA